MGRKSNDDKLTGTRRGLDRWPPIAPGFKMLVQTDSEQHCGDHAHEIVPPALKSTAPVM